MAFFGYGEALGWLAFLSLIPFFLIVLRKPRTQEVAVPTLMFFEKYLRTTGERSFLRRIPLTLPFLFQLMALLLLSLFFVEPFLVLGKESAKENVVLVIDTSASMSVGGAFEKARNLARENVGARTTIILAGGVPRIFLQDGSKAEATRAINNLRVGGTDSPLGDAMMFAEQHLMGENPFVVVISDFLPTSGTPLGLARASLESKATTVLFFPVETSLTDNVGIVDVSFENNVVHVLLKNYGSPRDVRVETPEGEQVLSLDAYEARLVSFTSTLGQSVVRILNEDGLMMDNEAHIVVPDDELVKVALISIEPSKYVSAALRALEFVTVIPVSPSERPPRDTDVYIFDNVQDALDSGVVRHVEDAVKGGAGVIVVGEKNSDDLSYGELLPLTLEQPAGVTDSVVEHYNKITGEGVFGSVAWHFETTAETGSTFIRGEKGSLLQVDALGEGVRVFSGFGEDASNFHFNPFYPVFWSNLIRYVARADGPEERTVRGGSFLQLPSPTTIASPSGVQSINSVVVFDEVGVWDVGGRPYGVSVLNDKESGLQAQKDLVTAPSVQPEEETIKKDVRTNVLALGVILLFGEMLLARRVGEF